MTSVLPEPEPEPEPELCPELIESMDCVLWCRKDPGLARTSGLIMRLKQTNKVTSTGHSFQVHPALYSQMKSMEYFSKIVSAFFNLRYPVLLRI
jgi:hypothetical protein